MANWRSRLRRHLDARGPGEWPCPCCGYHTLHDGVGDYDLCPVCFWEDAGDQLRWPTLADGPNGISLIDAQRNFVEIGACHAESLAQVRKPKPGEEREPGWRPIDPAQEDFESGPHDPRNLPWPAAEELYWWRPNYFRRPENQRPGPAPRQTPSNASEQMMARILDVAPETEAIDIDMRSRWEEPAPLPFCTELASFVVEAVQRGDTDVALRIVNELNAGLTSGDGFAATCVSVGFLEPQFEWSDDPRTGRLRRRWGTVARKWRSSSTLGHQKSRPSCDSKLHTRKRRDARRSGSGVLNNPMALGKCRFAGSSDTRSSGGKCDTGVSTSPDDNGRCPGGVRRTHLQKTVRDRTSGGAMNLPPPPPRH